MLGSSQPPQRSVSTPSSRLLDAAINKGKNLRDHGRLSEAIAIFKEAAHSAHRHQDSTHEADALMCLGSAQILTSEYRAALRSFEAGLEIANSIQDYSLAMRASGNIATIYSQLGDFASADAESDRAFAFYKKIRNPDTLAKARLAQTLQGHAYVCFLLEKYPEGYRDSTEAIKMAVELGNPAMQALFLDVRGTALMRQGRIAEAETALRQAIDISGKLSDQTSRLNGVAFGSAHLAELELEKPHPDVDLAQKLINKAFSQASPIFKETPQYYPIYIRGRILLQSGDKAAALAEFIRAVRVASEWRGGALPGDATNTQTVALLQEIYVHAAHLEAEKALETNDNRLALNALEILADNRAESLREQLREIYVRNGKLPDEYFEELAQLQAAQASVTLGQNTTADKERLARIRMELSNLENHIGNKSEKFLVQNEINSNRNSLRFIQHTLSGNQALISISLGKERSYLWALITDKTYLFQIQWSGILTR